jgi:hypothetical protein
MVTAHCGEAATSRPTSVTLSAFRGVWLVGSEAVEESGPARGDERLLAASTARMR